MYTFKMSNNSRVFPELTICSVYHSDASRRLLELNYKLVHEINKGLNLAWIAVNNSPRDIPSLTDVGTLKIIEGINYDDLKDFPDTVRGAFHHAFALQKTRKLVTSRFVLFLDNDFFIIRPNWVKDVLAHMQKNSLSFFGSTWHPKYFSKYRYFPSEHCLFVDLAKIDISTLDFRPILTKEGDMTWTKEMFLKIPWPINRFVLERRFIGRSMDTGHRIYVKYSSDPSIKYECLQPVFKPRYSLSKRSYLLFWPNFLFEKLLPDRLCFVPKKSGYYTMKGFAEQGFFDASRLGWEEYLWNNRPFGVHMRSNKRRDYRKVKRDLDLEVDNMYRVLNGLVEKQLKNGD